ncbi:MAG: hypothetical protein CO095_11810, partial [Armatimonadetes bacterium CG_4_9_14_3_um_filter_58_7]
MSGLEEQRELPFPTLTLKRQTYKLFGLVTNLDWARTRRVRLTHSDRMYRIDRRKRRRNVIAVACNLAQFAKLTPS